MRPACLLLLTLVGLLIAPRLILAATVEPRPAPAFTAASPSAWLNSPPLRWEDLRGEVVLLDVWTYDCWNCYRSFPWLHALPDRYAGQPLRLLGVHTPELAHEREVARVRAKLREFAIDYPVLLDNGFAYWNALGNRYWPAFYLIDKRGQIRGVFVGETHAGDRNARAMETLLDRLLAEPGP